MRKYFWSVLLTVVVISLTACGTAETPPLEPGEDDMPTEAVMPDEQTEYEITVTEKSDGSNLVDVSVVNLLDGQEVFFITLENVENGLYQGGEFHNKSLYIVKVLGSEEEGWQFELWKYDIDGEDTLLYSAERIFFQVAPDESYIVIVQEYIQDIGDDKYVFLDKEGNTVQTFTPDTENGYLDLESWSLDGHLFWGRSQLAYKPIIFYQVNVETWEFTAFDISDLPLQHEYAFNPNTGQFLYSDLPPFINMDNFVLFEIEQTPVRLYLYDFNQGDQQPIAIAVAQSFRPEWIDDEVFAYSDPVGRGRIHYNLADGTTTLIPGEQEEEIEVYPRIIPVEFEPIMDTLLGTGAALMLPLELPVEEGYPLLIPRVSNTSGSGKYWVYIELGEDCQGAQACIYGRLAARKIGAGGGAEASLMPFWSEAQKTYIRLARDITGYYIDPAWCQNCRNGELYWIINKTEYMASLKNATEEELTSFVNAIIENSLPEVEE